jgi:hypothetical protein
MENNCITNQIKNKILRLSLDNNLLKTCVNCKFTNKSSFSPTLQNLEKSRCIFCNYKSRNYSYELYNYYSFKLQVYLSILVAILSSFLYFKIIDRNSFTIIQFLTLYMIIDQLWIRINNVKVCYFIIVLMGVIFIFSSFLNLMKYIIILIVSSLERRRVNKIVMKLIK